MQDKINIYKVINYNSVQQRDQIFVKSYGCFSFANNMKKILIKK